MKKFLSLCQEIKTSDVIKGGRVSFVFYFFLTHILNLVWHFNQKLTRIIAARLATPKRFLIKNKTGYFWVSPFNDSMTVSADYYDSQLVNWLEKPPKKRIFVDIGAHIGRYSILAGRKYYKVVAFEPNPAIFSVLENNIKANNLEEKVNLHKVALSDKPGTVLFTVDDIYSVASGISDDGTGLPVSCALGDEILKGVNFEEIDFIKIDVEGHDREVLNGLNEVLTKMPMGSFIMIEFDNETAKTLKKYSFEFVKSDGGLNHLFEKR
ncbi:MAG: FkbM family methyltransferase [Candidatus Paceibacterota bacterium]